MSTATRCDDGGVWMSALQAAERVLTEASQPLHVRELTRRMLAGEVWHSEGKTPDATVSALLGTDINRHGASSRFQRTGKNTFGLRTWGLPDHVAPGRPAASVVAVPLQPSSKEPDAVPAKTMSFAHAAEHVLERFAGRKPMHYRAITEKALELGVISTAGQTPEATMYAQIITEMGRQARRGETPRFVKHGRGYVGLSKWQGRGLAAQIEQHNAEVRRKLLSRLKDMPPDQFEALIGELLAALGFEAVTVTGRSGDGGIDVRGTLVVGDVIRTNMAVQVKRWRHNVQAPIVQQVRGALGTHDQGLIITTSDFSSGAREEAARPNAVPVGLMHGDQLVALLVEHDIGVQRTSHDLLELGERADE
jgi:restriction system protein